VAALAALNQKCMSRVDICSIGNRNVDWLRFHGVVYMQSLMMDARSGISNIVLQNWTQGQPSHQTQQEAH